MRSVSVCAGLSALLLLCGCTFKRGDHPDVCDDEKRCGNGEECIQGFCVAKVASSTGDGGSSTTTDAGGRRDAATAPGPDGGTTRDASMGVVGEPCAEGTPPEPCYEGESETLGVGECRGGQRACVAGVFTQCLGQVKSAAEVCDQRDNDCDGTADDIGETSCDTGLWGNCGAGKEVCRGALVVCQMQSTPMDELCNGDDDDCDNKVDEIAASECFPEDATGCTQDEDGVFMCFGLCHTGHSTCLEGVNGCADAVASRTEECLAGSVTPADDDCDGQVDEGCPCSGGQNRECYSGTPETKGVGICRGGVQECQNDEWGECVGQVLRGTETCANMNADDDCNGEEDDILGLGESCNAPGQQGICVDGTRGCRDETLPVCVPGNPESETCDGIDQNCNGEVDDGIDFTGDEHCGRCFNACREGSTTCCRGDCVPLEDLRNDPNNCGECGKQCGDGNYCCWNDCLKDATNEVPSILGGQVPPKGICGCTEDCGHGSCCGTSCVDLQNDSRNCGLCGNDCSAGIVGGFCCNGSCVSFQIGCDR